MDPSIDVYVAGFVARCDATRRPGQRPVAGPGLRGLLPSADAPLIRLLVIDDRAHDELARLMADARGGMMNVFAAAGRCAELVGRSRGWMPDPVTAMVCRDLRTIPEAALPSGLTLRPVRRLPGDSLDGVPLEEAAAAAKLAAPEIRGTLDEFAEYLRSLPAEIRLYEPLFTRPDPGVAYAMTAAALRAALAAGARHACLDASDAGLSTYLRLGFEAVTRTTHFFRPG